jgi:integration host factor subunit alpha
MSKNKCLTKANLADTIYSTLPVDKQKAVDIVEDYIEIIKEGLEQDGKVMISGFGSYEVNEKNPRRGINPQSREPLMLRARRVIKFRTSQILRDAVNGKLPSKNSEDDDSEFS